MKPYSLALLLVASPWVNALEALSMKELLALCQSKDSADVAVCSSYITGFLDGAIATDPSVAQHVLDEMEKDETFSERAMRTRLGSNLDRFGPSYYAGFCIPGELPVDDIRSELAADAAGVDDASASGSARDYLYQVLQQRHPCSAQSQ